MSRFENYSDIDQPELINWLKIEIQGNRRCLVYVAGWRRLAVSTEQEIAS